jgi:hypothetical protein
LRVVLARGHKHNDAPHCRCLLRTDRKRPSGSRAAEHRDERAPVHCPVPPMLPKDSTSRYGRRLLHCGNSARLMTARGQKRRRRPRPSVPCTSAAPLKADVNSTPWLPPLCATSGLMQCSKDGQRRERCRWRDELTQDWTRLVSACVFRPELKRNTIHAITKAGRLGAIVEDMSEMASTARAMDLGANQKKKAAVLRRFNCPLDRGPETRPTSPTFELGA